MPGLSLRLESKPLKKSPINGRFRLAVAFLQAFKLGDQLMSLSAQYYTYVARPVTNPQTNLKVTWSLLYPIKRGIDIQELIKENQ